MRVEDRSGSTETDFEKSNVETADTSGTNGKSATTGAFIHRRHKEGLPESLLSAHHITLREFQNINVFYVIYVIILSDIEIEIRFIFFCVFMKFSMLHIEYYTIASFHIYPQGCGLYGMFNHVFGM